VSLRNSGIVYYDIQLAKFPGHIFDQLLGLIGLGNICLYQHMSPTRQTVQCFLERLFIPVVIDRNLSAARRKSIRTGLANAPGNRP
jgi:hypothetical protein